MVSRKIVAGTAVLRYHQAMAEPSRVRALIARLEELDDAFGVDRTRLADALIQDAHDALVYEGDHGVWQATRPGNGTRKTAAQALETTVPYIQKRSSRYAKTRK